MNAPRSAAGDDAGSASAGAAPELTVRARLDPHGPATAILLTDEQVHELLGRRTGPVVVTIAGRTARLRVMRMHGANMIGLSAANRDVLGVEIGDEVVAQISPDTAERTVDIPPLLADALAADAAAKSAYDALSFTRRREIAESITSAKKPETAQRRLEKALADLR